MGIISFSAFKCQFMSLPKINKRNGGPSDAMVSLDAPMSLLHNEIFTTITTEITFPPRTFHKHVIHRLRLISF